MPRRSFGEFLAGAALSMLLILAVACGGDDRPTPGREAEQLSAKIVRQLGAEGAFDALIYAFERGYSAAQVLAALDAGRLQQDGWVASRSGGSTREGPAGAALGRVVLPERARALPPPAVFITLAEPLGTLRPNLLVNEPLPIEKLREAARTWESTLEREAVRFILDLLTHDYSPDQIVDALIDQLFLDEQRGEATVRAIGRRLGSDKCLEEEGREYECRCDYFLRDANGDFVVPAGTTNFNPACRQALADASIQPAEPGQRASQRLMPGVYAGQITQVHCTSTCGTTCEFTAPMRITLNSDGTVQGTGGHSVRYLQSRCEDPSTGRPPAYAGQAVYALNGNWNPTAASDRITVEINVGNIQATIVIVFSGDTASVSLGSQSYAGRTDEGGRWLKFEGTLARLF